MISTAHHLCLLNVLNVQVHYITFTVIVNTPNKNNNNLIWLLLSENIFLQNKKPEQVRTAPG